MVILNENPLENIRNTDTIRLVMKNAGCNDGDTLDEAWPRKVNFKRADWVVAEPEMAAGIRH